MSCPRFYLQGESRCDRSKGRSGGDAQIDRRKVPRVAGRRCSFHEGVAGTDLGQIESRTFYRARIEAVTGASEAFSMR